MKLQERLAKLAGGVAVVKVGAATETEMKEKKHPSSRTRLQATRAALEEGIVPGGGVALLLAAKAIDPGTFEGRRGDRRAHHQARARGAPPPAGVQRRPRGLGHRQRRAQRRGGLRPERRHRRDGRPGRERHHRPGDGHALCAAERGVDRQEHHHHRGRRGRGAREGQLGAAGCRAACPTECKHWHQPAACAGPASERTPAPRPFSWTSGRPIGYAAGA